MAFQPDLLFADLAAQQADYSPTVDAAKADHLRERLFVEQRAFIEDPSRRKTLLCPRRAGKTFSASVDLVDTILRRVEANCVYITLTKGSARALMWQALKDLDHELELGGHFHNTMLTYTLPGPRLRRITLTGAETRGEIEKLRGQKYDKVIIDECKSFPAAILTELVRDVIGPALNDTMGSIILMGTPGNVLNGVFYEGTKDFSTIMRTFADRNQKKARLWSGHAWSVKDNVAMPHLWAACLADKESYGWSDDHPVWQREYLGRWISDDDAFVYKFNPEKNSWVFDDQSENKWGLPEEHDWKYLMGCDLGYDDPFALVVVAYSETCAQLYQVYDYAQSAMTVSDIARLIKAVEKEFGEFEIMVGDRGGLGKMVLAELSEQWGVHIEPAEKTEKRDYIELLNSDLIDGRIMVLQDGGLAEEMNYLVWDASREKEDRSCMNHICDAFLYTWRYSYHNFSRPKTTMPSEGSIAWFDKQMEEAKRKIYERKARDRELDGFQRLADDILDDTAYDEMCHTEESWLT